LSEEFKILVHLLVLLQDFFFEVSLFLLKLVSLFFLLESLEFCLVLNVHLYNNFLLALLSFLLVGVLVSWVVYLDSRDRGLLRMGYLSFLGCHVEVNFLGFRSLWLLGVSLCLIDLFRLWLNRRLIPVDKNLWQMVATQIVMASFVLFVRSFLLSCGGIICGLVNSFLSLRFLRNMQVVCNTVFKCNRGNRSNNWLCLNTLICWGIYFHNLRFFGFDSCLPNFHIYAGCFFHIWKFWCSEEVILLLFNNFCH